MNLILLLLLLQSIYRVGIVWCDIGGVQGVGVESTPPVRELVSDDWRCTATGVDRLGGGGLLRGRLLLGHLQVDGQVDDGAQVVVAVDVAVAEDVGEVALDAAYEHVRIDGQYVDERVAVAREQHVYDLEYLQHLVLLARVEAVYDDGQTCATVAEYVNRAHLFDYHIQCCIVNNKIFFNCLIYIEKHALGIGMCILF